MKKIGIVIIMFIVIFLNGVNVIEAFSPNITINSQGSGLTLDSDKKVTIANSSTNNYAYFHIKNSSDGQVFCTSGAIAPPGSGDTCTQTGFDNDTETDFVNDKQTKGVAYIINLINGTNGGDNEKYWWSEFLINSYLGKYNYDTDSNTYKNIISNNDYKILDTNKSYSTIIAEAASQASATYTNINLSISPSNLSFTKNTDGYYYSNKVKITTNGNYNVSLNNTKFESDCNALKECIFKIKEADISPGTTENLTVTISSKESPKTYYIAQNYDCGSGVQNVTLNKTKAVTTTVDSPQTITGSITVPKKGELIIHKKDENGNYLSGVTLLIKAPGYTKEVVTDGKPIVLNNLEFLNYAIAETKTPDGYAIDSVGEKVELTENKPTAEITIINKLIKIDILKIDENNKPLSGAIIKLMDKDGNTLEICKDENGNNSSCRWTTTDKAYRIEGIPAGTYYLKEISTPKGYNVNPNKIKIVIDNYGKVKIDNKEVKDNLIKISNELTTTKISKISAVNSKELPGATLEILNSKKEKISCIIKNDKGEKETLKECKWVSKDKPTYVLGLESGKYYLSETIAPEGYELNTNMVEFEIKADGSVTEVEMKNELSVKVPDTLSSRSALLIAISMFDIALGIGIITYVKKNKVEE